MKEKKARHQDHEWHLSYESPCHYGKRKKVLECEARLEKWKNRLSTSSSSSRMKSKWNFFNNKKKPGKQGRLTPTVVVKRERK